MRAPGTLVLACLAALLTGCVSDSFEFELSLWRIPAGSTVAVDGEPIAADSGLIASKTFPSLADAISSPGVHLVIEQDAQVLIDETFVPGAACAREMGNWVKDYVHVGIEGSPYPAAVSHDCYDVNGVRLMTSR